MRVLLLTFLLSFNVLASEVADVTCDANQAMIIKSTFNTTYFKRAQFQFSAVQEDARQVFLTVQDLWGTGNEFFNLLWKETYACPLNNFCISTDFSNFRGYLFAFPNEVLTKENMNFTMRIRDNFNRRSYFASCRSTLR